VTVTQGGTTVGSGTTTSYGCFVVNNLSPGSYTITVSKSRFTSQTRTITLCSGASQNFFLVADTTTYVCCNSCADPIKKTLSCTDSNGTHTLTHDGSTGWRCEYSVSVDSTTTCPEPIGQHQAGACDFCRDGYTSGSVHVRLLLTCPPTPSGQWGIVASAYAVYGNPNTNCTIAAYVPIGCESCIEVGLTCSGIGTPTSADTCGLPLALTWNLPSSWDFEIFPSVGQSLPGLATGTVTVTE
jgi:hypothetical protein